MSPEDLLSLAKREADEVEVFQTISEETPVLFESNRLKHLYTHYSHNIVLRIIKGGKIGIASSTEITEELVERAIEAANIGVKAYFQFPTKLLPPSVEVYDPKTERITIEEMVGIGESIIQRVCEHTPKLLCYLGITKGIVSVRLINSRGGEVDYKKSYFSIDLEGVLVRDTDMLFVMESQSSCSPIIEIEGISQEIIRQLELSRRQAKVSTGSFPVILMPRGVWSALFSPLSLAFNGRMVVQGASPIAKRIGEEVFDRKLFLWDDATFPLRPNSRPWDDEGVPSQRTPLIQEGKVVSFLFDLQTAGILGGKSTGNASRVQAGIPSPMVTNLFIGEGDGNLEEMIRDIKEGLLVERLIGAEQGNILGGEFRGNVLLGYKIERGEITGRVKDTMLSGNIYQALKDIWGIGRRGRWVGNLFSPPLYLHLSVASKG